MMRLTLAEGRSVLALRSQTAILKRGQHRKFAPYVFTEQGVAMLSSVLNSERAVQVNIAIMRAFVKLREVMATHKDLANKIASLERKYGSHDEEIQVIFQAIKKLLEPPPVPAKRRIGFVSI
jgi:phage regulator Rha-like protein